MTRLAAQSGGSSSDRSSKENTVTARSALEGITSWDDVMLPSAWRLGHGRSDVIGRQALPGMLPLAALPGRHWRQKGKPSRAKQKLCASIDNLRSQITREKKGSCNTPETSTLIPQPSDPFIIKRTLGGFSGSVICLEGR